MSESKDIMNDHPDDKTEGSGWDAVRRFFQSKTSEEDNDRPVTEELDLPESNVQQLLSLFRQLDSLILKEKSLQNVFVILSDLLRKIFRSSYVEFFLLKGNELEYQYINVPAWMLETTHRLLKISPIVGMRIPLFEGSYFKAFVDGGVSREIMTREDLVRSIRDFLPPDSAHNIFLRDHFAELAVRFFSYKYVFQVPLMVNGRMFGYFSFLQKKRFSARTRTEIIMMSEEISSLIAQRQREDSLPAMYDGMNRGYLALDLILTDAGRLKDAIVSSINRSALESFAMKRNDVDGKSFQILLPKDKDKVFDALALIVERGHSSEVDFFLDSLGKTFRVFFYQLDVGRVAAQIDDVTERLARERENEFLAQHDSLTGLYNRSAFSSFVEQEIRKAKRDSSMLSLFFIDLDGFKQINDTYGHDAGDKVLAGVASSLKRSLREMDIVCRFGGDEFIVLVCDVKNDDNIRTIERKISGAVSCPVDIGGGVVVTPAASVGTGVYPLDGICYEEIRLESDKRMYEEKGKRRKQR